MVSGIARGDRAFEVGRNQSPFIPVETRHRLEDPGCEQLLIVYVRSGAYLGDDDIVRFDNSYNPP